MPDKIDRSNMTMTDIEGARATLAETVRQAAEAFYLATGMRPEIQVHELPRAGQDEPPAFGVRVRATLD